MSKKKTLVIVGLIIIIGIIILFFTTDLFKTKEMLFWKSLLKQKDEVISTVSNKEIKEYEKSIKDASYIKEGNLTVNSKFEIIKPIEVKIYEKNNNQEKCMNTHISTKYGDINLGEASIINDNDYYLIKSDLIDEKYVGFENNNLKELAKKLGIKNTDFIPDKVNEKDYTGLFNFNYYEIKHFQMKYLPIYKKYIHNKDYIKQKDIELDKNNQNVTAYELQLTEKQINEFIIDVLKTLEQDDYAINIISNKIKMIDSQNRYSDKSAIKEKIDEVVQYLSNKNVKDEKILSIIIYEKGNNVIKTEIKFNDRTLSIERIDSENKLVIKQYGIKNKSINLDSIEGIISTIIDSIGEVTYKKEIIDDKTCKVDINIICKIAFEKITMNYNYVETIENNVEEIIHKEDIEYVELKNIEENMAKKVLKKAFENE